MKTQISIILIANSGHDVLINSFIAKAIIMPDGVIINALSRCLRRTVINCVDIRSGPALISDKRLA